MKIRKIHIFLVVAVFITVTSCEKNYLGIKPDKALMVPTKLSDLSALLENWVDVFGRVPSLHHLAGDDFFTTDAGHAGYSTAGERNSYVWAQDVFEGSITPDWEVPYKQVFVSNVVLEGLEKIEQQPGNATTWKRVRGTALFHRGFAFFNLAQMFAEPYNAATAQSKAGIPLRLSSDINLKPSRGTLEQTYLQILSDLKASDELLPHRGQFSNQPGQDAARALLARVYLVMGNYKKAQEYAQASLQIRNDLIDYNSLNKLAARPLPSSVPSATGTGNSEVSFYAITISYSFSGSKASSTLVDSALFDSYDANDLRKAIYFNNKGNRVVNIKANYSGNSSLFGGLTTSEMYLVLAECSARNGDVPLAMNTLNALLEKRWKSLTFSKLTAANAEDALTVILRERRKELVGRGLRWADLRRLNQDSRFALTLHRKVQGKQYSLSPGSNRYVFPIPVDEIQLTGIEQNPR